MCFFKGKKDKWNQARCYDSIPYYNYPIRRARGVFLSDALLKEYKEKRFSIEPAYSLKIIPKFFDDIIGGYKTFEIRKNDRDFKVGDLVKLNEFLGKTDDNKDNYSGRYVTVFISRIYDLEDVLPGYIAFDFILCQRFI